MDFEDASMGQAKAKIGMYGGTGSGKTWTALQQATKYGQTAMISTERGADFYVNKFKFKNAFTTSCEEALELVDKAVKAKMDCLIVDQLTHFWESAQNEFIAREHLKGSKTWAQIERNQQIPWTAWGRIKRPYKKFIHTLMDAPLHVWMLSRLAIEYKMGKDDEPVKTGERMATEKDTPYEPHILVKLEFQPKGGQGGKPIWYALVEKDRSQLLQGQLFSSLEANPGFTNILDPMFALLGKEQQPSPEVPYDESDKSMEEIGPTAVQRKLLEVLAKKGGVDGAKVESIIQLLSTEEAGQVINILTAGDYSLFENIEGFVAGIRAKGA